MGRVQVRRALHWLAARERVQHQRLAAALVLRELAAASPAVFNMHVRPFIDVIWAGIKDPALPVRTASVQALQVWPPWQLLKPFCQGPDALLT